MSCDIRHDWSVEYHHPSGQWMLYIPAGVDPADGQPLTHATPLHPAEATFWQAGHRDMVARMLRQRGIPIPGPCGLRETKWKRFKAGLRKKVKVLSRLLPGGKQ